MGWKYKRIEIIYLADEEEICITPYAAMSYVPRIGETLWIQGKLREELIEKDLPTVFKVEDVCYHVVSATEMNNAYDSVVLYVVRLGAGNDECYDCDDSCYWRVKESED